MSARGDLEAYVSYLCLVYHEARNVRFLIKEGYVEADPYEELRRLPKSRDEAWTTMQDLRAQASRSQNAAEASGVLADRFSRTLEELVALFDNPNWKYAQLFGGNRWSEITQSVIDLRDALDQDDLNRTADLFNSIPILRHGTGRIGDKLRHLDAAL